MKIAISQSNILLLVIGFTFLAAPSLTQVFNKEMKKEATLQETAETLKAKETLITLNDYPRIESSAGSERASLRNPFSSKSLDSNNLSNLIAPRIIVRGFGSDQSQDTVFMSVNNAFDNEFTLGQQVGNGFRVSNISPAIGEIEISNGSKRIRHKAQEF